ncbi:hypothetical protein [Streptomyces sp. LaPpAH-108]|nr:hypothetical protein [Streptomyces sp. LaPpAH-108]
MDADCAHAHTGPVGAGPPLGVLALARLVVGVANEYGAHGPVT